MRVILRISETFRRERGWPQAIHDAGLQIVPPADGHGFVHLSKSESQGFGTNESRLTRLFCCRAGH